MKEMISDFMWNEIKDIIPNKKSKFGRPETPSRKVLNGVFYVLKTGVSWKYLPREFGAPSTIHGRFRKWLKAGTFEKIMDIATHYYAKNIPEPIRWIATDTSSCKAPFACWAGKNPTDRGKLGIKKSIVVDFYGMPLAVCVGPANQHDSKFLEKTIDKLSCLKFDFPVIIAADSAYDSKRLRLLCRKRNICLLAATNMRRNKNKERYFPSGRWVVERTFGWLAWYRGLKTCWTKTKESFEAFLLLASSVQLFKKERVFG